MSAELIREAKRLARAGQVDAARQILLQVTEEEPENEAAWIHYVDLVAGNDQERIEALRQYVTHNPDSPATNRLLDKLMARQTAAKASLPPIERSGTSSLPSKDTPGPGTGQVSLRPQAPARFRKGPTNVAPRLAPGMLSTWLSRGVFFLVLVGISLLAVLPLWDGRNLFSYLSITLPNLSLVQAITTRPPVVSPTPGPDSVLYVDLSAFCPGGQDLPPGSRLEESASRLPAERNGTPAAFGLERYFSVRWRISPDQSLACELFVYQSLEAARQAYGAIEKDLGETGVELDLGDIGRPSAANLIEGPQYVYNLAYLQERVVVSMSSTDLDRDGGKSALERFFGIVAARLSEGNTS
jgi:hypothetical protein